MNPYHEEPYVEPEEEVWNFHDEVRCWCRAFDAVYVGAALTGADEDLLDRIMKARHLTEGHGAIVAAGLDSETRLAVMAAYEILREGMTRAKEQGHGW